MKIVRLNLLVVLTLLAGIVWAEEGMSISDLPASRPIDDTPRLAFGQMIRYGEKVYFSPCRDRSFVQFEDASRDGHVGKALDRLGLAAGKKLYVEVLGIREGDFLKASQLNFAQTDGRCQLPGGKEESWRAAGNAPSWALAVGAEFVQLKRLGQPEVVVPAGEFKPEGGVANYTASKDGQRLALRFEQTLCYDSSANAVFGWAATVTVNGQALKGCAWQR